MLFVLVTFVQYTLFPLYCITCDHHFCYFILPWLSPIVFFTPMNRVIVGVKIRDISCSLEPLSIPVVFENKRQISPTKFVYVTKSRIPRGFDLQTLMFLPVKSMYALESLGLGITIILLMVT